MSLDTWLIYLLAATGLSLSPGPNGMLALTHGALHGSRRTLFTIAGGVAATVYGLHCPENTFTFVALWYSLGVLLLAALGAVVGRWVLRW